MRSNRVSAIAVILALLTSVFFVPTTTASAASIQISSAKETSLISLTNKARAKFGLRAYRVNAELTKVARAHAMRMARNDRLYHNPQLRYSVSSYRFLGENVGYSPSITGVQSAFMNSPSHRANILDRDFTQVGIGVVVAGDRIWVTEVFRRP